MTEEFHRPVLLKEVLAYLKPEPNQNFVDATVGGGGHARPILEKISPKGRVLAIDWDKKALDFARTSLQDFGRRVIFVHSNFSAIRQVVARNRFSNIRGVLFDLGLSSFQIERSGRGFTFGRDEKLDMRFNSDADNRITAEFIVNTLSPEKLYRIIKEYGQERFASSIARHIVAERKRRRITSTFQLVEVIRQAIPAEYRHRKIHFATKTFQALRIAVNKELDNLEEGLREAFQILEPTGRIVVISFHSLEDRIVKNFFRRQREGLKILTKKPVRPSADEIFLNPRSRSAKLRAVQLN